MSSGYIFQAVGLEVGVRGANVDNKRVSLIVPDDIDNSSDSISLSEKKMDTLLSSVLPTREARTLTICAQNLIIEHGCVNRIVTGQVPALINARISGPHKMVEGLETEKVLQPDGRLRDVIIAGVPTWPFYDLERAQNDIDIFTLPVFLRECQHDLTGERTEKVLSNWDDDVHVITKSQFAAIFGTRQIPRRWYKYAGNDWSRTKSAYHANVAGFVAVSGMSERLPGFIFMYDTMSFEANTEADDVGLALLKTISPTVEVGHAQQSWDELVESSLSREGLEKYIHSPTKLLEKRREVLALIIPPYVHKILPEHNYRMFRGSHEQNKNALEIYRSVYGLPFSACNPGEDGGIEWINHYQKVDYERPHPFKPGVMGYSRFFLIVEDDKADFPTSLMPDKLHGSDLARYQFKHWRNRPIKVTESGAIEHGPMKMNDDFGNLLMFLFHDNSVQAAPMTEQERHECQLDARLQMENIEAVRGTKAYASLISARQHELGQIQARERQEQEEEARCFALIFGRRLVLHSKYRRRR